MTKTLSAVAELLKIPCSQHKTSIPTCPECGSPVAVWAEIERLRAELDRYRSSVTTGGPPAPITEGWTPGDSSRPPTAPPEELVVSMLLTDEEAAQVAGRKRLLHWRAYGGQGEPPPEELVVALPGALPGCTDTTVPCGFASCGVHGYSPE